MNVSLGSAAPFAVLAASTVTSSGLTVIRGSLGLFPGTAITGFGPGKVINGVTHDGDVIAATAQRDLKTAYNYAAGLLNPKAIPADASGLTLAPGLYKAPVSLGITGTVTLDAQGDCDAVWVFQIPSTLTAEVGSKVSFVNGGRSANVFWQVGSSATLKTDSVFVGTIMAMASISLGEGVDVEGRLLARVGAVTLLTNLVVLPS